MTREEAIQVLNMVEAHGSLVMQAKDMAIKALEQEPCSDAISRHAMHIELEKWITYGEYKYSNATKYLYDRIDRLPPVNPQESNTEPKADILDKIMAEIDVARYFDKDTKLCKNANASGLEVAMEIIDKYKAESEDGE